MTLRRGFVEIRNSINTIEQKNTLFEEIDAFILPSYSEGLPMAVLEAWSYGVFTFISKYCNFEDELKMPFAEEIKLNEHKLAESLKKYLDEDDKHESVLGIINIIK